MNRLPLSRRQVMHALGAASLGFAGMPRAAKAADDHLVRFGYVAAPDSLNPFATYGSFWPTSFNYDFLVGVDAQRFPDRKGFAKEWSVSSDGLTWRFKIWPGMKWSDGQPATAHDVAFTFDYIRGSIGTPDELNVGWNNTQGFDQIDSITVVDDQTVDIKTKAPSTFPIDAITMIVPGHIWKDIKRSDAKSSFLNEPPVVGTGPLVVMEWERGRFFRLASNKLFRNGSPSIDGLIYEFFQSTDPIVQGLKRGDIDYSSSVTAAQWEDLKKTPNIWVGEVKIEQADYLAFNTWSGPKGAGSTKALQDRAFRDAIGFAIDQKAIVRRALRGHGDEGVGPIVPVARDYFSDLSDVRRRFDLDEARRRLEAAGYHADGSGGNRKDKEGNNLQLQLITGTFSGTNESPIAVVELVSAWLGEIGIAVTVTRLDAGALNAKTDSPENGGGGWDLLIASRWLSPYPVDLLRIASGPATGGNNVSYWSNPDYDQLVKQVGMTIDLEKRQGIVNKAVRLVYQEAPYIFLDYPYGLDAHRTDRFTGWGVKEDVSQWGYFPFDRLKPL
jgi:peptide/nickel transport system substrate-binding protein